MKICHSCKKDLSLSGSVGRRDVCSACGADLHCCMNCAFYDPSVSKQCREPAAELVREKTKANFCDYFFFAESQRTDISNTRTEQARKAIDELFKK